MERDPPHCAILDLNLAGQFCLGLARTLRRQQLPFLFYTGYDEVVIPPEFADVVRLEKPVALEQLTGAIVNLCRSGLDEVNSN